MKQTAIISFKNGREEQTKILAADINESTPGVTLRGSYLSEENYYKALQTCDVEKLTELLQEALKKPNMANRYFQVLLPNDLLQIQCFKVPIEANLPLGNTPDEQKVLRDFCLKEYPDADKAKFCSVTVLRMAREEEFIYITCAFIQTEILTALEQVFLQQQLAVFSIEPQIYSTSLFVYYKFPEGNVVFKDDNSYLLFDKKGILTLNALDADEETNCQLLLAIRQKALEIKDEEPPELQVVQTSDFFYLPKWVKHGNMLTPMDELYGLGSTIAGTAFWAGNKKVKTGKEEKNGRFGKLFNFRKKNL